MRVATLLILLICLACQAVKNGKVLGSMPIATMNSKTHRLEGFKETILVGHATEPGKMALIHVGDVFAKVEITHETQVSRVAGRSIQRNFFVAFEDGHIIKIDGDSGVIERDIIVADTKISDIEVLDDSAAYISVADAPLIKRIDLFTGAVLQTVNLEPDLSSTADNPITTKSLFHLGNRLFVTIAHGKRGAPNQGFVAVLDMASHAIEKKMELKAAISNPNFPEDPPKLQLCWNPNLPFVHDRINGQLIVQCSGKRPSNTGLNMALKLDSLELVPHEFVIPPTFNGHRVISFVHRRMVELMHTSTPTPSTHLVGYDFDDAGRLVPVGGPALFDLFEVNNELQLNQAETLAMLPNHCPSGFCALGKGISFVDIKEWRVLPKLMADELGFEPNWLVVGRD